MIAGLKRDESDQAWTWPIFKVCDTRGKEKNCFSAPFALAESHLQDSSERCRAFHIFPCNGSLKDALLVHCDQFIRHCGSGLESGL